MSSSTAGTRTKAKSAPPAPPPLEGHPLKAYPGRPYRFASRCYRCKGELVLVHTGDVFETVAWKPQPGAGQRKVRRYYCRDCATKR